MKKNCISGLLIVFSLFMPVLANAQVTSSSTVDVQIQSLLSEISSLQQQLKSLVQSVVPTSTPPAWGHDASSTPPAWSNASSTPPGTGNCGGFDRDLSVGSRGEDVTQLQQMLQGDGFLSASSTGFFGALTARALQAFQVHFSIAASSSASGFFGSLTRNFLMGHCGQSGGMMGPSTPPMRPASTSTPFWGGPGPRAGTSTGGIMFGPMGSSTGPRPCDNNDNQGAASVLFVPHVILPMMPCGGPEQGSGGQNTGGY